LARVLFGKRDRRTYGVEFVDPATSLRQEERVDLDEFITAGLRVAKLLAGYATKLSPSYNRIQGLGDAEILGVLESRIVEVQQLSRTVPALAEHLESETPRELRDKLKGIRLESNGIRNAVVKANRRRHDYIARVEEREQLRKLGIGSGHA
jgi:hypothetical protein